MSYSDCQKVFIKISEIRIDVLTCSLFNLLQEIQDAYRARQTIKDTTDDSAAGGIDIEKAKKFMQSEDKFDKKLYQEKIKMKHQVS